MSESLKNIKIPYPTEGVIRTAALDDTIAPTDSLQAATNLNFDRIGAVQTRKGLTEFADDLDGEIKNFGTLNNSLVDIVDVEQLGDADTFAASPVTHTTSVRIDDEHILVFWRGTDDDGFAQVMEIDIENGGLTPLGSPLEFDTANYEYGSASKVDDDHFILFWCGTSQEGLAQVFTVDLDTWAVTLEGSPLSFDTLGFNNSCVKADANHFLNFWNDGAGGSMQIFTVNLTTYAVTAEGSIIPFYGTPPTSITCSSLNDGIHFIAFWTGFGNDGFTTVVEIVDPETWALSTVGTPFEFDTDNATFNSCASLSDGQHFINFWQGTDADGFCRVFEVDLTTFNVSYAGAAFEFDTVQNVGNSCLALGNGKDFINFWRGDSNVIYARIFEVNQNTFNITAQGSLLNLGASVTLPYNSAVFINTYKVVNLWKFSDNSGLGAVFELEGEIERNSYLYAQQEDGEVYNWNGVGWVLRRSNLNTVNKARFTQYLNHIWMVNGNEIDGGDPVATSNGGVFGNNLVPVDFPPGDFIQAGFEGRVWVADKLNDVIYFTDIVQFTPPDTYTLSFNLDTNFIKNFSPQNGQTMTGLLTTPRALLLFKQDSIYRIYGAFSVDSYPAYNVGTYSQESIVQTKDGIYFHHSSGFYKFAYDSQPIEISRRVIDFIQAIPRAYYEEVKGIYDGFDAVEWHVGPVTVEGVTYTNCVMRFTISTQVWTIYDYPSQDISALIQYDNQTTLNMIMGTEDGKVNKMDDGFDDLGTPIYFEMIDRWRSYTDMYAKVKSISGLNMYTENAAGTRVYFQSQKAAPNAWDDVDTITEQNNALFPNANTRDFEVGRLRMAGFSKGTPIVIHGMEILSIQEKGFDAN